MIHLLHDPGHGGSDPGAVRPGIVEKDVNLAVAHYVADSILWNCYHDFTRSNDETMCLEVRREQALSLKPDLVISYHCNAAVFPPGDTLHAGEDDIYTDGLIVFYRSGDTLSFSVAEAMMRAAPLSLLRFKQKPIPACSTDWTENAYAVLSKYKEFPAVLVEMGFVTSPRDKEILTSEKSRPALAACIMAGVARFLEMRA